MKIILRLKDNEYPLEYIDHVRKTARAVLINEKGQVGLNKLHGKDMFGIREYYETPGGGFKKGETSRQALLREVKEESGYECEIITPIGIVDDYYNLIHRHNKNYYFLCKSRTFLGKKLEDYEQSMIEDFVWIDLDKAIEIFQNMNISPISRLVKNRELPILLKAKEMLKDEHFTH